jgi:predicted ABC-type ATPase
VARAPRLYVIAGVNGAGKSSLAGAAFAESGVPHYDPDAAARALREADPRLGVRESNSLAWHAGKRLLERAIAGRLDLVLETTLGASTIPRLLARAADEGFEVRAWYAGLDTVERHLARVKARVRKGGHDIPVEDIRRRFEHSRLNLVALLPRLAALRLYDNSAEADPALGHAPRPRLVLHMERGRIVGPAELAGTPAWARPIVAAAIKVHQATGGARHGKA